jgi:hypothetical protein
LRTLQDADQIIHLDTTGLPKYAAAVAVELWQTNNTHEYTVKVGAKAGETQHWQVNYHDGIFYYNQTEPYTEEWRPITNSVTGCESEHDHCPLEKFIQRSVKWVPTKPMHEECALPSPPTPKSGVRTTRAFIASFACALFAVYHSFAQHS